MERILNENRLEDLKEGDIIYQVELQSVDGEMQLKSHELIFDKYLDKKIKIPELEVNESSVLAELHTAKAPGIPIRTDISCGYFKSEKQACWEFVNMIKKVYEKALSEYENKFDKFDPMGNDI